MADSWSSQNPTLALNTKVEKDFVTPLTAVRGSLEILRDFPDLGLDERQRFVGTALRGCVQLEHAVDELAKAVYAAGEKAQQRKSSSLSPAEQEIYAARVKILEELDVIEIDFSSFEFSSSKAVDDFYDVIDEIVDATGRDWYFLVNQRNCSVWPEAWVAFAHRGKKVRVNRSLGTVRYAADLDSSASSSDPDLFGSRDAALARIAEIKSAQ